MGRTENPTDRLEASRGHRHRANWKTTKQTAPRSERWSSFSQTIWQSRRC